MNRYLIVSRHSDWTRPQVLILQSQEASPDHYRWTWSNTGSLSGGDTVSSGAISAREIERMLRVRSYLEISEESAPQVLRYLRNNSISDNAALWEIEIVRLAMCDPPPPPPPPPTPKTNHKIGAPKGRLP